MFLAQVLDADRSCQQAVNDAAIKRLVSGLPRCSTHTGGYCRARQRLPLAMVRELARRSGRQLTDRQPTAWHWRGRPVRLVDGTTVTMPDTDANQAAYPQSRTQRPGLGFPLCRLVGIVCLGSGALLDAAIGRFRGKGGDEQTLLRSMLDTLQPGDLLLGDAYYATYFLLCELQRRGVDGVFEQYGARRRRTDFRRGQRLGPRDHLIELEKPPRKPEWMTHAEYARVPDRLVVRELKAGRKILVTTLCCPKTTTKTDVNALYRERWHVELDLRHLKTTLGMNVLSCRTPAMVEKEIWVYLLAYNLIRMLMVQSASLADTLPRQLSFKHAVQLWRVWIRSSQGDEPVSDLEALCLLLAEQRVGNRPGRIEPRALKRRQKPYSRLMLPRPLAREKIRLHGYPGKIM
jgi:hypothetical protein